MTLDLFQLLSLGAQLYLVHTRSTFLACRWDGVIPILLHHMPTAGRGFFVELGVAIEEPYFTVLRSFSDSQPLEDYAQGVKLPEE